jgi:hypothetical protein
MEGRHRFRADILGASCVPLPPKPWRHFASPMSDIAAESVEDVDWEALRTLSASIKRTASAAEPMVEKLGRIVKWRKVRSVGGDLCLVEENTNRHVFDGRWPRSKQHPI